MRSSPRRPVHFPVAFTKAIVFILLALSACAQTAKPADPVAPLPQDTGTAGLKLMLRRLHTTARFMHVVAHPDDEHGGTLTLESRSKGASVVLMTLNRGEGGQNKVGSNLFDVLGVLRTLELTAADRYYGVEQRFSRVADFGFSKTPEETLQKWHGKDIPLGDIVRVVRTFRPDIIMAGFSGTDRDGHGHHQVSSQLAQEAFRAAADPNRFPEQIKEGLQPWQAKKMYVGNVCGFFASDCPAGDYTLRVNSGKVDPVLGMEPAQFAMLGLKHQLSQGAGAWTLDPGDRFNFYKLVDSVVTVTKDKDGHEQDFFDGIETSLPGLSARLGAEESKAPWLKPALEKVAAKIQEATDASEKDPSDAAAPLFSAAQGLREIVERVDKSNLSNAAKSELLLRLREKQQQAEIAVNLALNTTVEATVARSGGSTSVAKENDALTVVSPGQKFELRIKLHNGSKYPLLVDQVALEGFSGWTSDAPKGGKEIKPGESYAASYHMQVPAKVEYTRPYWHRNDPETDAINTIDQPQYEGLPFPPSPFKIQVRYSIPGHKEFGGNQVSTAVVVPFVDDQGVQRERKLAVVPAFSVSLEPGGQVIRVEGDPGCNVTVGATYNLDDPAQGTLHLQVPSNWRVEPAELPVAFHHRGEKQEFKFRVFPASLKEGRTEIRAVLESAGAKYSEGYSVVTREDLDTFYYYQPALQHVSIVDVKVPAGLKVAYVMGAGDDIPTTLEQIGMDVTLLPADKLGSEDLSRYGTIVLGIRAYDTQKSLAANNKKLLDYVSNGGTLLVQYNSGTGDFNGGHFTPYSATLSRARVSVEEAPVQVLAPDDGVFHYPNPISQKDFDGWVQERGLYFMSQWDDKFKPLLACQDPGEPLQKGGLLRAQYGKGTYIYTGYAFFRQLPAGVPGAVRLYVDLLAQSSATESKSASMNH